MGTLKNQLRPFDKLRRHPVEALMPGFTGRR
jgi:hypothetical protein